MSSGRTNMKRVLCRYCLSDSGFIMNGDGGLNCKFCGKENYRYDDEDDFRREGKNTTYGDLST